MVQGRRISELQRPDVAWTEVHAICCETALGGAPLPDGIRWPFFGQLWVGPYEELFPDWTWVWVDDHERVFGYITLCPNTLAFEKAMRWRFRPRLALQILLKRYPWNGDARRILRRWVGIETSPEDFFDPKLLADVKAKYPAHLHTNLRSAARGSGGGKRIWELGLEELRRRGVSGIHLFCGDAPVGFYQKCGFEILQSVEWKAGVKVHLMVRLIPRSEPT